MQRGKMRPDETIIVGGMSEGGGQKKPSSVPISVSLFPSPCFHLSLSVLGAQYSSHKTKISEQVKFIDLKRLQFCFSKMTAVHEMLLRKES